MTVGGTWSSVLNDRKWSSVRAPTLRTPLPLNFDVLVSFPKHKMVRPSIVLIQDIHIDVIKREDYSCTMLLLRQGCRWQVEHVPWPARTGYWWRVCLIVTLRIWAGYRNNFGYSEALDRLQLKRYCCRRMVLTHVDLIEKLLQYNRASHLSSFPNLAILKGCRNSCRKVKRAKKSFMKFLPCVSVLFCTIDGTAPLPFA